MASRPTHPSDMLSRRLYLAALRSHTTPVATNTTSPFLLQLAALSTYDKPAAPSLEENRFYDKYKGKLTKLKSDQPERFNETLEKIYQSDQKREVETSGHADDVKGSTMLAKMKQTSRKHHAGDGGKHPRESSTRPNLASIIKLELLEDKSASEISAIWSEFFSKKDQIVYATIPSEKYLRLAAKGKQCPLFIYALPRESGYEFILGQCAGDDWYYTPLISYQSHGEYAPYSLVVRHYTELMERKGIVLMKGEIASDDMKPELASLLLHQTQLMYGSDENFKLVSDMNNKPDRFNHMSVIEVSKQFGLF